jgi:hypothetical protein
MKNICIYTLGRSGSNYLRSFVNQPDYTLLNEPFTLSSRYNASQFLIGMSLLYQSEKIDLPRLKDLISLTLESQDRYESIKTKLLDDKLLKLWFEELQTQTTPKNILWKFMAWYHSILNLNINNMFESIDYLIINYRKNTIKQWISSVKAMQTGEWITENKSINYTTKILWNKKDYLCFLDYTEKNHQLMKINFNKFNKNKTIICYENLSDPNNGGVSYLNSKFQKANINLPINDSILIQRQSDPNKPLEDNFFNKQEFLKDYDSIKDQISTNIIFD